MRAMVLEKPRQPLVLHEITIPEPAPGQVLVRVSACAVCRTDLHIVDGELKNPRLPLVPGHQIVGTVVKTGAGVDSNFIGKQVGIPWLGWTCGKCKFCLSGRENLCDKVLFTGYTINGGFAEYTVADARYSFFIPDNYDPTQAAPLLCAGLIGYRSLSKTGKATRLGIYGFGSAAHIITQVAAYQGRRVFAFTRPGDKESQQFAIKMGAVWAGGSDEMPPEPLEAAIIFAPVGNLVPNALKALEKGGIVVCGGIYMSDIPSFPYNILWEERSIVSVANLTRNDAAEFLKIAPEIPIKTSVKTYPLESANEALNDLRWGKLNGSAVLVI
ncbi:MAG: zinc-dependent alcohol dehydrogenase family protein [Verrucomicrobiia bacterium]